MKTCLIIIFVISFLLIFPPFAKGLKEAVDFFCSSKDKQMDLKRRIKFFIGIIALNILVFLTKPYLSLIYDKASRKLAYIADIKKPKPKPPIYPVISKEQLSQINESIKISFVGDLILLKDVVEDGYDDKIQKFDYAEMFSFISPYWKTDDLSLGVFEGPVAGESFGYSTSRFDDGIPLHLNFPLSFAQNVKDAGIDLVTLSNNHLLDQGIQGYLNTLDNLDSINLEHIGAFRNREEKDIIKIIQVKGKKFAILAYTYGSNYYKEDFFFDKKNIHITNVIVKPDSKYYPENLSNIENDFNRAKQLKPDAIIVMPHMGGQFRHEPDGFQKHWVQKFIELGADIILSDHPHAVQPIEYFDKPNTNKKGVIIHCPGNFINSYTDFDGDASMMVEIYLDSSSIQPIATSIIPLYSYCKNNSNYIGLPIYDAITNETIYNGLSRLDYNRIVDVHKLVTKSALGVELPIDHLQQRYYLFPDGGYFRNRIPAIHLSEKEKSSEFIKQIEKSNSVCFVGNSITEGTLNGGYGWYEPIQELYPNITYHKIAKGSKTSVYFNSIREDIAAKKADFYVLSIGCNDIRYREEGICAMTAEAYIKNLNEIVTSILKSNPSAEIAMVSPWMSQRYDPLCKVSYEEKNLLYRQYSSALLNYCKAHNYMYIDPNPYLTKTISHSYYKKYLNDWIHPNASYGIELYSRAVINSSIIED